MSSESRAGRPKASSRETLAEAACELFLERGYEQTSVADITRRAGVSRSSFFNYFSSKGAILWSTFDERIDRFATDVATERGPDAAADVHAALVRLATDFAPDSLALALVNARAMGVEDELDRESSLRLARVGRLAGERLIAGGADRLHAEVVGAAYGGAVLAAVRAWAHDGPGRTALVDKLSRALAVADRAARSEPARGAVRQLRVVAKAEDFEQALSFYRDVVGMPQREAYEAEGGARVAILDAGRATLELANPAQVAFIDAVEAEGGRSEPIRLALEVEDADVAAVRWASDGAQVEASARRTPWGSTNARLRGPAGLQLTAFHEGDER